VTRYLPIALLAAAALWWFATLPSPAPTPGPAPAPVPAGELSLVGLATGDTAATDLTTIGTLAEEVAEAIAWDGTQVAPKFTTGAQFDALRVAAREWRCRGASVGKRQPNVAKAIGDYLTKKLGTSGGPVDAAARAAWVAALREVGRACREAVQ